MMYFFALLLTAYAVKVQMGTSLSSLPPPQFAIDSGIHHLSRGHAAIMDYYGQSWPKHMGHHRQKTLMSASAVTFDPASAYNLRNHPAFEESRRQDAMGRDVIQDLNALGQKQDPMEFTQIDHRQKANN